MRISHIMRLKSRLASANFSGGAAGIRSSDSRWATTDIELN
jgi:hypothetical protein